MEYSLRPLNYEFQTVVFRVLILILMEYSLRQAKLLTLAKDGEES